MITTQAREREHRAREAARAYGELLGEGVEKCVVLTRTPHRADHEVHTALFPTPTPKG